YSVHPRPVNASARHGSTTTEDRVERGLTFLLQNVFRKEAFRPGQLEIIRRAISLNDVVGLLPTGAGKSLCYQIAAFTQPGVSLVVDPLLSLIVDQREGLRAIGIHRTLMIRSSMGRNTAEERNVKSRYYEAF